MCVNYTTNDIAAEGLKRSGIPRVLPTMETEV